MRVVALTFVLAAALFVQFSHANLIADLNKKVANLEYGKTQKITFKPKFQPGVTTADVFLSWSTTSKTLTLPRPDIVFMATTKGESNLKVLTSGVSPTKPHYPCSIYFPCFQAEQVDAEAFFTESMFHRLVFRNVRAGTTLTVHVVNYARRRVLKDGQPVGPDADGFVHVRSVRAGAPGLCGNPTGTPKNGKCIRGTCTKEGTCSCKRPTIGRYCEFDLRQFPKKAGPKGDHLGLLPGKRRIIRWVNEGSATGRLRIFASVLNENNAGALTMIAKPPGANGGSVLATAPVLPTVYDLPKFQTHLLESDERGGTPKRYVFLSKDVVAPREEWFISFYNNASFSGKKLSLRIKLDVKLCDGNTKTKCPKINVGGSRLPSKGLILGICIPIILLLVAAAAATLYHCHKRHKEADLGNPLKA